MSSTISSPRAAKMVSFSSAYRGLSESHFLSKCLSRNVGSTPIMARLAPTSLALASALSSDARIAAAPAVRGERAIGWVFHYAVGIVFAAALLAFMGADWARRPTLIACLATGWLTIVFPWFVMQPAMGAGVAAARTPHPPRARLQSLLTHTVFGVGLYLAFAGLALLFPSAAA